MTRDDRINVICVCIFGALACLAVYLLSGCCNLFPGSKVFGGCQSCYGSMIFEDKYYDVKSNITTPKGWHVDATEQSFDVAAFDARMDKIETCLLGLMTEYKTLTEDQRVKWGCWPRGYDPKPLSRDCLEFKIVPAVKGCSDWQFTKVLAPDAGCLAKGITPTPTCPCRYRTYVQGNRIVVTPPALYLWEVTRIVTGCSGAWSSPFAKCMEKGIGY
jgi:hypothetical protein